MRLKEIRALVESTGDPAFAVDGLGLIVAWNSAAEALFGVTAEQTMGKPCGRIVQGADECGLVCSDACTVLPAARKRRPISNYDLQIETRQGRKWCNVSILIAQEAESTSPYCIHIVRPTDVPKRLELLMRDFIVTETGLSPESARRLGSLRHIPTGEAELTKRQGEILRLLVKGTTTVSIAAELHISRTTVNNHVQQILHKLNAHTRLEAIRRAERTGSI
jgi:PAS domain S-box-containing protein